MLKFEVFIDLILLFVFLALAYGALNLFAFCDVFDCELVFWGFIYGNSSGPESKVGFSREDL